MKARMDHPVMIIPEAFEALLALGKAKMVALIAVARKLLVILNAMIRDKKQWQYA